MNHRMNRMGIMNIGLALCATFFVSVPVNADEANVVRPVKMDPEKLAGINLPPEETFIAPEDVLEGHHRPRGEVLHYGDQLILEPRFKQNRSPSDRRLSHLAQFMCPE